MLKMKKVIILVVFAEEKSIKVNFTVKLILNKLINLWLKKNNYKI